MLHILLLILKIIGIILAVILGIIILLLGIILFVPIRYEISAKCDGTIDSLKAKAKVTWLLHLLRADVLVKGNKLKWQVRAAWIKKSSAMALGERKEEKNDETKEKESEKVAEEDVKDEVVKETAESIEEKHEADSEKVKEHRLEEDSKESKEKPEDVSETDETVAEEGTKKSVGDKIKEKYEKIKETIDKIVDLLTDESHVNALKKIKKELFVLLKRLKPKKVQLKLKFGFDDPSVTGKVLGGISIIYPFLGDTTEIIPDFENQILKGNVYIKGRIRICHFAALAVKLLLCKDIRTSYKDIKNFKL